MRSSLLRVRRATGALRAVLLTPGPEGPSLEAIAATVPALQQAAVTLEQLRTTPPEPSVRPDLEALAHELRTIGRLAEQGENLSRGTLRLLRASVAGEQPSSYQQDGEPAPVRTAATVEVKG